MRFSDVRKFTLHENVVIQQCEALNKHNPTTKRTENNILKYVLFKLKM